MLNNCKDERNPRNTLRKSVIFRLLGKQRQKKNSLSIRSHLPIVAVYNNYLYVTCSYRIARESGWSSRQRTLDPIMVILQWNKRKLALREQNGRISVRKKLYIMMQD